MSKRNNWEDFKNILEQHHITTLYHFTDRDNLENIIKNGGLFSWKDCEERGITIPKPGRWWPRLYFLVARQTRWAGALCESELYQAASNDVCSDERATYI